MVKMAHYRSHDYQTSLESTGLSVQEVKIDFPWWPSWISNGKDFSSFDLQVTMIHTTKFRESWLLVQVKGKIYFLDGHHIGFPFEIILAIFDLQVVLTFPTKFRVN